MAVLSGYGVRLRLQRGGDGSPRPLRLLCRDPLSVAGGATELTAPNGTRIELVAADPPLLVPPIRPSFVLSLGAEAAWAIGRVGMLYRDLVPDHQGGSVVASQIRIEAGRTGRGLRAPPRRPLPGDLLLQGLGPRGLRGSGSALRPATRRLRAAAARHPPSRARELGGPGSHRGRLSGRAPDLRRPRRWRCRRRRCGRCASSPGSASCATRRRRRDGSPGGLPASSVGTPASRRQPTASRACGSFAQPARSRASLAATTRTSSSCSCWRAR